MSRNTKQRRATIKRKLRQADAEHLAALRLRAIEYEGITEWNVNRMSKERLEETIRHGKRRKGLTGAPRGLTAALIAAALQR